METRSSVFKGISRGKKDSNVKQNQYSVITFIGLIGSLTFIINMLIARPQNLLVVLLIAAIIFLSVRIYSRVTQNKKVEIKVNFESIRNLRIKNYSKWLKELHVGHDRSVDQLVEAIDRDLKLVSANKILGVHLIVGPAGTGKTQLTHLIGQTLFGKDNVFEFNFKHLDQNTFTNLFLDMLDCIAKDPHQVIVFDNAESMQGYMLEPFLDIFNSNRWLSEDDKVLTSFSGCLFLATTSIPIPKDEKESSHDKRKWIDQSEQLDYRLISHCTEIISWNELHHSDIAKIVLAQIYNYWQSHSIELEYVAPEVIFQIIKENHSRSNLGMHPYPQMIRNKSARALEQVVGLKKRTNTKIELDNQGHFKIRSAA